METSKSTPEQPEPNWSIEILMSVNIPVQADTSEEACLLAWDEAIKRYGILDVEFGDIERLSTSTEQNESL